MSFKTFVEFALLIRRNFSNKFKRDKSKYDKKIKQEKFFPVKATMSFTSVTDIEIFRGRAFRTGFIVLEIVRSKHHLLIQHGFRGYTVVYVTSNFWYSTLSARKLLYIYHIISLFCNFLHNYAPPDFLYFFTLRTIYCYYIVTENISYYVKNIA